MPHRDIVVEAAGRGIHMYLEKPLCRTLAEADEMVAACERTHAKLAIAHTTRHSPRIPVVQEMLASTRSAGCSSFAAGARKTRAAAARTCGCLARTSWT